MMPIRFGALDPQHRGRLAELLEATEVFSTDEVAVAIELFDDTFGGGRNEEREARAPSSVLPSPSSSYEFLGRFADDGTLVAYACFGPTPGADGTFDLYWIAVHPAAQGAGEGSRLLAEVENRLQECGGRLIVVETSSRPAYAGTRRFYGARGYTEAARVADFYAPADDRVIYAKRLAETGAAAREFPSTPRVRGARHHE